MTQKNQEYMEAQGLKPLPVFHYGEDESILKALVEKYDYIAFGGMVPVPSKILESWLDYHWETLVDEEGNPKVKVHGFGMTTQFLVRKYPWYSVDSMSPILSAAMGRIYGKRGDIDLSRKSGNLDTALRKYIEHYLPDYSIEELVSDYKVRTLYNIRYFLELEKELTDNPPKFINPQKRLF
jgi:hypothetical protein